MTQVHGAYTTASAALGDAWYHNGTIWVRLAGNITTTKKFLRQTGDGAISAVPAWDTVADGDVPATHSGSAHHTRAHAVDGASDHSAGTQGNVPYAGAAGAWSLLAPGTNTYVLKTGGAGANPAWGQVAHSELSGVTSDQHHARSHSLMGASDHTGIKIVVKASNETVNNSSTLQNDDELLWAMGANETWSFVMWTAFVSGATPDIKFGWSLPVGAAMSWQIGTTNTLLTASSVLSPTCDGTDMARFWFGTIVNGANAGNAQLQWAQDIATASNTTVYARSYIQAFRTT